jgi:hypothetical protein
VVYATSYLVTVGIGVGSGGTVGGAPTVIAMTIAMTVINAMPPKMIAITLEPFTQATLAAPSPTATMALTSPSRQPSPIVPLSRRTM